jgi:hypothetical protein
MVALGMGAAGKVSRIVAPLLGAELLLQPKMVAQKLHRAKSLIQK